MYLQKKKSHYIDIIFVLALFFLFAFSSTTLIILGSHIYQRTSDQMQIHFDERTISSYLTEKIRQNDTKSTFIIKNIDNCSILCINTFINEESYTTYLYAYDHHLYELFTRSDLDFDFTYGEAILSLESLNFTFLTSNLLEINYINENNQPRTIYVSLHTQQ